ncbi:MAG: hypothetical protein Q8S17_10960, partial [Humidesulfovibrio sp.]|nr:hypothetical protein [Humidesulfovibrio sp.]
MKLSHFIATLSRAIVLPGLSRRTGEPCRVVSTRQLVLACDHAEDIHLVGCLDPRGEMYRVAVRDIIAVQQRLIVHAEKLPADGRVVQTLESLAPASFSYKADRTPYTFCSLDTQNSVELIGAWPSRDGGITAQMIPICGFLIPASDPLIPPCRQIGHLWPNGDFARPSGAEIVSFIRSPGVMLAASYPFELAARLIVRNAKVWGEAWVPGDISEEVIRHAADIHRQCKPRKHTALTHDMLARALERPPVEDLGDLRHDYAPTSRTARMIWHNGYTRDGVCMSPDHTASHLFAATYTSQRKQK